MDLNQLQNPQQMGPQPGDEHLPVQFYMGAVPDTERTAAEGHPCFKDVPLVKVIIPGDRNSNFVGPATLEYQLRFPVAWKAFQANQAQPDQGLPLREWPAITKGQCEELSFLNIRTVEQLAAVSDGNGAKIMGFNDLKRKAEVYLKAAKDSSVTMRLDEENANLRRQLEMQQVEMGKLSARLEAMEAKRGQNVTAGQTFGPK